MALHLTSLFDAFGILLKLRRHPHSYVDKKEISFAPYFPQSTYFTAKAPTSMKIINCGKGIHAREVPGLEKMRTLPDNWCAFTNLDLALPGRGVREIDMVLVIEDRIILIDLKDWLGPIQSRDGHWFNGKRDHGRSPVHKISENSRDLLPLFKKFLSEQEKSEHLQTKLFAPRIDVAIVLTATNNKEGIAESEKSMVFPIDFFMKTLRNRVDREKILGRSFNKHKDLTSDDWISRFRLFFNASSGIFQPGIRRYGGYRALQQSPSFSHSKGIFNEFDVQEEGVDTSFGLLRKWDFTKAQTKFQTEEGRSQIAGRERTVLAWLLDRNPDCESIFLKQRSEDPDRSVSYWEVYERRRQLKRLSDYISSIGTETTIGEKIELARQILASVVPLHDLNVSHLDIGLHSVWIDPPTTIRLSHLMAASFPEVKTLGEQRYQFLSSCSIPEDILSLPSTSKKKDIFLLGCAIHALLFGREPSGNPPEWSDAIDTDGSFGRLHPWFSQALDLDPSKRFEDAGNMLAAFNAAVDTNAPTKALIEGLERFKTIPSQRQIYKTYPESALLKEDDRVVIWRSDSIEESKLVKLWKTAAIGDIGKERSRILSFLEKCQDLIDSPLPGLSRLLSVHWTGDSIVLVEAFIKGNTLEKEILAPSDALRTSSPHLALTLSNIVSTLHGRGMAHGDITPANIVLDRDKTTSLMPVLIDYADFSPIDDGERSTPAYTPSSGGRMERDRFAVLKIAEELLALSQISENARSYVKKSIEKCRVGPPPNATLLPLDEALHSILSPSAPPGESEIAIAVQGAVLGPILSDEGAYWISRFGNDLYIRGATERLELRNIADTLTNVRARRIKLSQSQIRQGRRFEYASFRASIDVTSSGFTLVDPLVAFLSVSGVSLTPPPDAIDADRLTDDDSEDSQEFLQDEISERMRLESRGLPLNFDCHRLWRRLMDLESSLSTEAIATGDSSYRKNSRRHVIPIQLVLGELDFDRNDFVLVEREDNKGRWFKIGRLDISASSTDFIAVDGWFDAPQSRTLIASGSKVRFQSHYENTSRTRRSEATNRILRNAAAANDLLSVFQPSANFPARTLSIHLDEAAAKERYDLNEIQIQAFLKILNNRPVGLLQGPPGTGKTRFIGALIHYVLTQGLAKNVLLASQAHEAVNNASEMVLKLFGKDRDSLSLIRIGHEDSISEFLRPWHVAKVERGYKDKFRATANDRLLVVAHHIGLSESVAREILHFDNAVSPILKKFTELAQEEQTLSRLNSLKETVSVLLKTPISRTVLDLGIEDFEQSVTTLFLDTFSKSDAFKIEKFRNVIQLSRDIVGSVSTWQRSFETFLAGTRQVVAGTCVGLGRTSLGLTKTMFDLVIVDEAARCTPSELAVPIQAGKWIVLVGDHAQLEPQHRPEILKTLSRELALPMSEISKSDFERVFQSSYGRATGATLTKQYRMLPPIGRVVSKSFYNNSLLHGRQNLLVAPPSIPDEILKPLTWIETDGLGETAYQRSQKTHRGALSNPLEADTILALLRHWATNDAFLTWLETQRYQLQPIGVICAYSAQRELIWKRLQTEHFPDILRRSVKVDTIDSYQGKENIIVIVSLVRNNSDGPAEGSAPTIKPGFLSRSNRVNVAISRAMDRLVIVGARSRWPLDSPIDKVGKAFIDEVRSDEARIIDAAEVLRNPTKGKKRSAK